jgi:multisubunit Na+/H+ antiporter MnhB subunit
MEKRNFFAVLFFAVVAVFLVYMALMMHSFGNPGDAEMDQYIIDNTQAETGANNGVTAVVFDYRGFDTLGEATVLFTAVAGVVLAFRRLKK